MATVHSKSSKMEKTPTSDLFSRKQQAKLIVVMQNFFTKALQTIVQARAVPEASLASYNDDGQSSKINKWFNLQVPSTGDEWLRGEIKQWRAQAENYGLPSMIIETYLDLRLISPSEIVLLEDDNGSLWTVIEGGSKKKEVVVERWLIEFDRNLALSATVDELPLIYKQAIVLLRVLYAITRLLPAYKLKKYVTKLLSKNLVVRNRFVDPKQPISSKGRIGLSKSIIPHQMLMTESHMTQRSFEPIETTLGSLRVSVSYRNHYKFKVQDREERLSNHFLISDKEQAEQAQRNNETQNLTRTLEGSATGSRTTRHANSRPSSRSGSRSRSHSTSRPNSRSASLSSDRPQTSKPRDSLVQHGEKNSLLPCTSLLQHEESSPTPKTQAKQKLVSIAPIRPGFQPFKVGSISNSPPPLSGLSHTPNSLTGSSMERRISITSNRSGSNASLAALLRNARGSTSSSNTPNTMTISGSQNNFNMLFPRSISSSHGSHLQGDDHFGETVSSAPRFSSSFGSRQSRRFSNSSRLNSILNNDAHPSLLGTSVELNSSSAPFSGLYVEDDISSFVQMIDDNPDLRLSRSHHSSKQGSSDNVSSSHLNALNRFQLLKSQHQQLGESVSASLILHHNQMGSRESQNSGSGSKPSSRKSSHSIYSPPPSLPTGSFDNSRLPSITSRLNDSGIHSGEVSGSPRSFKNSYSGGNVSFLKSPGSKLVSSPLTATTMAHATHHAEGVSGLATSPSIYVKAKRPIKYEDVFEDDDDTNDYFGSTGKEMSHTDHDDHMSYDNDDLLFEMTDTK